MIKMYYWRFIPSDVSNDVDSLTDGMTYWNLGPPIKESMIKVESVHLEKKSNF